MKFEKDFKEAIKNLPSKEKDKLILRLLKKDLKLANRLYFELVDPQTTDQRREVMEKRIIDQTKWFQKQYHSPGYLMMDLRYLSGEINEYVYITKDKFGEVSLNILMLTETLKNNIENIKKTTPGICNKFCIYIIARTFKILTLISALHEDYRLDFKEGLRELGNLIGSCHYLMETAMYHGLDVNWLILDHNIPEDIVKIHRDIRKRGYLK